ncbi:MAG: hypothetical protein CMC15_13520, partial [Flavobacteriaceae bacterium]|nr:hypothetical protein [Flavobacteriaceae bacterium]
DAATGATSDYMAGLRDFMNGISSGVNTYTLIPTSSTITNYPGDPTNKPLQLWSTGDFNGGWSMVVYTTYYSITV